jgi:hypothetical protein
LVCLTFSANSCRFCLSNTWVPSCLNERKICLVISHTSHKHRSQPMQALGINELLCASIAQFLEGL